MKTKIDLAVLEQYLTNETEPESVVNDLLAVEEDYTTYHLRHDTGDPQAADRLFALRELRKAFQKLL